ncbi:MAG: hypothetical protein K0R99_1993 [Microbacterium sp.]|jgi:hypothetical protein|nr:hypothetical protein [Microbacterium sp.]
MTRDRRWMLIVGLILLVNAAVILTGADGRVEGYVGGAVCALGGSLNVVLALRGRSREHAHVGRKPVERSSE